MIAIGAVGLGNADDIRALYADLPPAFTVKDHALSDCPGSGRNLDQPAAAGCGGCMTQTTTVLSTVRVSASREDVWSRLRVQH
jgi:hypothetical protein